MHRNHLIKLIEEYQAIDSEINSKQLMLEFIKRHPNCFARSLEEGHITASAWLLDKKAEKVLLIHHAKLDRWFQLGGHADGDSDVLGVAVKEAQEESGILAIEPLMDSVFDIDIHEIPANSKDKAHYHYDVRFLLQVKSDEKVIMNEEAKELRWIGKNIEEFPTQEESIVRMFNKWLEWSARQ